MTPTSEPFGRARWIGAAALLIAGFALLAFALLMDVRLKESPYQETPNVEANHGDK